MKNILFLLAFLPTLALAQREVKTDTVFISNVGGLYFRVDTISYMDNGPNDQTVTALGDTAVVMEYYENLFVRQSEPIAAAAISLLKMKSVAAQILRSDAAVFAITGRSPLKAIETTLVPSFLSGNWTLNNGTQNAVSFSVTAQGVLRQTVAGSTAKTVVVIGPRWIVLRNYPASPTDTPLFRTGENKWEDVFKTIALKK